MCSPTQIGLPSEGAPCAQGAIRGACCFLRRHDPFQVRRVEQPSVPQSQSSAEDTPTGKGNGMAIRRWSKRNSRHLEPIGPSVDLWQIVHFQQGRAGRAITALDLHRIGTCDEIHNQGRIAARFIN